MNKRKLSFETYLNYGFISLVLLEDVMNVLFKFRGVYLISFALLIFSLAIMLKSKNFRQIFTKPPIIFWGCWVLYSLANWAIKGIMNPYANILFYIIGYMVFPFSVMCIIYYEGNKNLNRLVITLLWIMGVYVLFGSIFQKGGSGDIGDDWAGRGGAELGNSLPLNACVLSFVSLFAYVKKYISSKTVVCLLLLSLFAIFFVATRKALGGWLILLLFFLMGEYNIRKPRNLVLLILLGVAIYTMVDYVLANTLLGARMQTIEEQAEFYNETNNKLLGFLGDRAFFYIKGWEIFLQNPITGIGLTNFPIVTHTLFGLHTEYMVQLCECGIIGTLLYVLFNWSLFYMILYSMKRRMVTLLLLGGMAMLLFIGITAWMYSFPRYFVIYGIILASCRPIKANEIEREKLSRIIKHYKLRRNVDSK